MLYKLEESLPIERLIETPLSLCSLLKQFVLSPSLCHHLLYFIFRYKRVGFTYFLIINSCSCTERLIHNVSRISQWQTSKHLTLLVKKVVVVSEFTQHKRSFFSIHQRKERDFSFFSDLCPLGRACKQTFIILNLLSSEGFPQLFHVLPVIKGILEVYINTVCEISSIVFIS